MDINELKELIDATIYPNGEKKIKASSHQSMLHEIVDYTNENIATINEGLEDVKNTLETQGNDVEQLKGSNKQTELNNAKVNQKIDNLASNIVGLGSDIKGSVKGADVIELPNVAINGVSPKYIISGNTSIDGMQSVQTPLRVKSVGANLWDNSNALLSNGVIRTDTGYFKRKGINGGSKLTLIVNKDIEYEFSLKYDGAARSIIREAESRDVIAPLSSATRRNFKSKSGLIEITIDSSSSETNIDVTVSNIQVAKTPSREFSKYSENAYYVNSETTLKSALKAKDYIENGTLFKNVFTTKEFKKDDIKRQYINENLVNNYAFYLDIEDNTWLKDGFSDNTNRIALFSDGETYSCVGSTIATDVEDIIFFVESGINYIMLKINRSKIDGLTGATPLDKFKAYMGNRSLMINYQANTEQVKLDTSGVVTTKSNGTIFIENIKNVTDFYTAYGLDVKDFKELVSIYKYEGSDLIQLDTSKAVFTTTLKHPDLTDGDLVFFEYKYLDSPLWGDNEIEYFNKNNVLQSENGKLWQKVEKASNEGVLTTELKEIV